MSSHLKAHCDPINATIVQAYRIDLGFATIIDATLETRYGVDFYVGKLNSNSQPAVVGVRSASSGFVHFLQGMFGGATVDEQPVIIASDNVVEAWNKTK